MSTARLNTHPKILPTILTERMWGERDFFLVDVGASGGLERHWQVFDDRLQAVAFEPLVVEAERLQRAAAGTKVRYEAAFVTCRNFDVLFPPDIRGDRERSKSNDSFERVSAVRAQALMRMNYIEQMFNAGAPAVYADRHVVLDEFIPADDQPFVDFIKIDTDGHDFPVLLGAEGLLQRGGALGLSIEAQFHGASHDYANTFSNIDRFMRGHGFSLFDLDAYRYSRAVLPAPFAYDIPAQTLSGQVMWGEAIYFRDLADPDYERMWPYEVSPERVLKLACLFELFGLPDCAAELLLVRGDARSRSLLDDLATAANGDPISYKESIRLFEEDPQRLYPSRMKREMEVVAEAADGPETEMSASGEQVKAPVQPMDAEPASVAPHQVKELTKKVTRLQKKIDELHERVRRREDRIAQLTRAAAGQKIV